MAKDILKDDKYSWTSTGPGGCDSHCIEHPCGPCHEDLIKSGVIRAKFRPDNHIVGKVYDLTQDNFNALIETWEQLLVRESYLENEVEYWAKLAKQLVGPIVGSEQTKSVVPLEKAPDPRGLDDPHLIIPGGAYKCHLGHGWWNPKVGDHCPTPGCGTETTRSDNDSLCTPSVHGNMEASAEQYANWLTTNGSENEWYIRKAAFISGWKEARKALTPTQPDYAKGHKDGLSKAIVTINGTTMPDEVRAALIQQLWPVEPAHPVLHVGHPGHNELRFREALEAIAADGWTEGQKNQGEFKGLSEAEIAQQVLAECTRQDKSDG